MPRFSITLSLEPRRATIPGGKGVLADAGRVSGGRGSSAPRARTREGHPLPRDGTTPRWDRSANARRIARRSPHQARLGELGEHVAGAVDRFRTGQHGAHDADEILHQYSRAGELWEFCWLAGGGAGVERTARVPRDLAATGDSVDRWQHGTPGDRGAQRGPGTMDPR
jgi:hypothetical protein